MRNRGPAIAIVVAVAIAAAAATFVSVESTRWPSNPHAFIRAVLGRAEIPPGGTPTTDVSALSHRWMGYEAVPGIVGLDKAHEMFLYDEPLAAVVRYVR